ncbi:MAG: carboxypeptidase regulatory-like domain-containing protein [Bryobacteraceae bacterium]|nr:carboxypeptidase regulatory-like domain-containing protein [Bryobacteraceae bacterium]MDW8379905.1 carboxypeptidase regulatory-like domain-containing protein [Bryobacterales bacterium]
MVKLIFVCSVLAIVPRGAHAQNVTGSIAGIVKDSTGAVVPNVVVRAMNTGTSASFTATSNSEGEYNIRAIPVGVYDLSAEVTGFRKFEARGIRLQVNEVARVDITLSVGATSESITVSGQVVTVDTTSATLKTVVDQKRISELPLNGRNATQLMRLVAGVVIDTRADVTSGTTYPGVTPVSVNGGRANTTNYILDGAQNNDHYNNAPNPMPNPDALQEFSVQTNNFSAEFGRNLGGIVNAVTRSGTNEFHGTLFEYLRNQAFNAANFFAPIRNGVKVGDGLKRNQFGGVLGGPVLIPKLYNGKDKSFFFVSYQATLQRQAPTEVLRVVPTAAQRAGDFSALNRPIRDPLANAPYPGNRIPASQFNPVSLGILEFIPTPASGNTIFTAAPQPFDDHQVLVRGDQQLGARNRLSGRYWRSWAASQAYLNPRNYLEQFTGRTWLNNSMTVTDTHTVSANMTNQFLFGFNRTDGRNVPIYPAKSIAALGAKYYNDDKPQYHVTVAGYWGTLNTGDTNRFLRDEYQVSDTVRWTRGRHNLTFGGEYGYGIGDIENNFRANGQWQFNGSAPFTTDSLADFMIGRFFTMTQGIGEYKKTRFTILNLFVNDSMKLARRFTLDLGLRWEPFFPYTDVDGKLASWYPGVQSTRYIRAPRGVVYPGDPNVPKGGYPTVWKNLGPRLGFAWDIFGDGKTALRGGYGIFFDRSNTISTNSQANQAPFGTVVTVNGSLQNSFSDPWAGTTNPFPAPLNPPSDTVFPQFSTQFLYAGDMRNANMQGWNLTLERQIPGGFVLRTSYAGSKGTRLVSLREINAAVYTPGATTATTNQRRPMAPALGNVTLVEPVGNSTYHAFQITAERRFARGFTLLTNYQLAKSLDDSSANKATGQTRTDPNNQRFDKGPSDFDRRHVFNLSGIYELPFRSSNRALNLLMGGWQLNSIVSLNSAFPFTVLSGVDNARTGTGAQRADLIGDPKLPAGRSRHEVVNEWLRRSAFAPNAIGTFGNLGRNTFRGPKLMTVDLGVVKGFQLRERVTAQFRFEVFNSLNHVNLVGPVAAQNNVNFMRTTSAFDPRILQFALRLQF